MNRQNIALIIDHTLLRSSAVGPDALSKLQTDAINFSSISPTLTIDDWLPILANSKVDFREK